MFAKISNGNNFWGIVDYAYEKRGKAARMIAAVGVCTATTAAMIDSFKLQSAMRPSCKTPVGHFALSFSPDDADRCTDEFMARMAMEYMRRMHFVDTQYVIFRHTDCRHPHVHVVYNRVNDRGEEISDRCDKTRSVKVCRALTLEYGLSWGRGKRRVNRERLRGKDRVKYAIYDAVSKHLADCRSWEQLRRRLALDGISVTFRLRQNGSMGGVVFTKDGISFGGSAVDKSLSFPRLCQRLGWRTEGEGREESGVSFPTVASVRGVDLPQAEESRTASQPTPIIASGSDGSDTFGGTAPDDSGGSGVAGTIVEAALAGLHATAHVGPAGGGGNHSSDDDRKRKNAADRTDYAPRRRRR